MNCRICDRPRFDFLLRVGDIRYRTSAAPFDVLRCLSCGVLVTTREGQVFDPRESYPDDYGAFVQTTGQRPRRLQRFQIAERLRRGLRTSYIASDRLAWTAKLGLQKGAKVLDVGCGRGDTGAWLTQNFGFKVVGIEPHAPTAEVARERGLRVHTGTLNDFKSEGTFDIVLLIHVLEHLQDPLNSLRQAHRFLRPGGCLVVALPNAGSFERRLFGASWDGWDIPRHVHHFNPPSLRHLLQAADFELSDLAFEWYSLLSRSLANRLHPDLPHRQRIRKFRLRLLESGWGLLQSSLRVSSALQAIAVRGAKP